MLRFYKAIATDPIFTLHNQITHLVCSVWCEADGNDCLNKLETSFKLIVNEYEWLKKEVVEIYNECRNLNDNEKKLIAHAFTTNNKIEELCSGSISPVQLESLPSVVKDRMKPLFVKFYNELLNKAKVPGDKLKYYKRLYALNLFINCPCCGFTIFESHKSRNREAYDHYLPKSNYPFASVNFMNLVPLCYKCNSDRKKAKDPIMNGRKSFYPFKDSGAQINISITLSRNFATAFYKHHVLKDIDAFDNKDIQVVLSTASQENDINEKIKTWDSLFAIRTRYRDRIEQILSSLVNEMQRMHKRNINRDPTFTTDMTLNENINDYEHDKYQDDKFLKIPFLKAILSNSKFSDAYLKNNS